MLTSCLGIAALAGAALACNTVPDETSIAPGAGAGGGGGAGGSAGSSGGSGGAGEIDAGADTGTAGSGGDSCVVGTLEHYCSLLSCPPTFAAARAELRQMGGVLDAQIIVQRACSAPDGSPRVSVSANYISRSKAFIYDAATEQLVGVHVFDDTGGCHRGPTPTDDHGFGEVPGYYGEESPDCGNSGDFLIPAACNWDYPRDPVVLDAGAGDAGALDAGADAGPHECIVAP